MPKNADSMKLAEVINNTAADLLRGPDPTIPLNEVNRTEHAFECAKEIDSIMPDRRPIGFDERP